MARQQTKLEIDEMVASMEAFRKRIIDSGDKQSAIEFLVRAGTHNPDGTLNENYK